MNRKGIILAGGSGSRLHPITLSVSKQLLPVYSKPMIYYPLSVLMLSGLREILVITTPSDQDAFRNLLGDGSDWGCQFSYEVQPTPDGLAQAFLIGEKYLADASATLILGDNLFYGQNLTTLVRAPMNREHGATIFAYRVEDSSSYGVIEFDKDGRALSLEEKPAHPRSNYAVTGLYFYDSSVVEKAKSLKPSGRGELEISDLNRLYLEDGELEVTLFGRGFAWLDTGTYDSLLQASNFVEAVEKRQGLLVGCPEEVAFRMGWINQSELLKLADRLSKSNYGDYLRLIAEGA